MGFVGTNIFTLAALQNALGGNKNSISGLVQFTPQKLKPADYTLFRMPRIRDVPYDIEGLPRFAQTVMGAYDDSHPAVDAALLDFAGIRLDSTSTPLYVTLVNYGTDTLKSATIHWSANGVTQPAFHWTGALPTFDSLRVQIGSFIAIPRKLNNVKAWVSNPNNQTDTNRSNDTINHIGYLCSGKLAGTYTLGGTAPTFSSEEEIKAALYGCGVSGPVKILVRTGRYGALHLEGTIPGSVTNNITFTADSGAVAAFDGGESDAGLICKDVYNMLLQGLTFGNTSNGLEGVRIEGFCRHVTIRDCDICASLNATSERYRAFSIPNVSGNLNFPTNTHLTANRITGGYYNICITYMSGDKLNMKNASIYIDSNLLTEGYRCGIYAYCYSSIRSLCHNIIRNRNGSNEGYSGMYSYNYSNYERVEGNRIQISGNGYGQGMCFTYSQNPSNYSNHPAPIINNEIRISGKGPKTGLLLFGTDSRMEVHHNSVHIISDSTAYGCHFEAGKTAGSDITNITRNLLVADGKPGYALYLYYNKYDTAYGVREWNNLYSTNGVAYAGNGLATVTALQHLTGQDNNTQSATPSFINLNTGLELNNSLTFACPSTPLATSDINGTVRPKTTNIGCYDSKIYNGKNLTLEHFINPVPVENISCYEDSLPITVTVKNTGSIPASFNDTPLRISVDVTGAYLCHTETSLSKGIIVCNGIDTLSLGKIPVLAGGSYHIKVTIADSSDILAADDTLSFTFNVYRVTIPTDEDFSQEPEALLIIPSTGKATWKTESGTGSRPAIAPVFGIGRLVFSGYNNPGASANAIFNSINLKGYVNPKLSFWYAHDSTVTSHDMTEVLITTDAGANYTLLARLSLSDKKTGWQQYDIDLSRFNSESCLSIVFRATSFGGGNQHLDRVRLTADADVALSLVPIEIGKLIVCDNEQVPLRAVIINRTVMPIVYKNDTIRAEMTGTTNQNFHIVYNRILNGYESDTVTLGHMNLQADGSYCLKACVPSKDDHSANDTIRDSTLRIYQELALKQIYGVDEKARLGGDTIWISALVQNNSNMNVNYFLLRMELNGELVVADTVNAWIPAGDTLRHLMSKPFIVPFTDKDVPYYILSVAATMDCDADTTNNHISIMGSVKIPDTLDLAILSMETPANTGKTKVAPSVTVSNIGNDYATNVVLHVDVYGKDHTLSESISENIPFIAKNDTITHHFTNTYTVPNHTGTYDVVICLEHFEGDTNTANDTLRASFYAFKDSTGVRYYSKENWTMGQSIPNPTNGQTLIPVTLPTEGRLFFSLFSAEGKLLWQNTIEAKQGKNYLLLDASDLSSGIYYYCIVYKNERKFGRMQVYR